MIVNSVTSIGVSFIIAFYFSWKLTLVILCFLPLIGLSGVFQAKMLTGFANEDKKAMEEAGQVSSSSILISHQYTGSFEFLAVKWFLSHRYPVRLLPTSEPLQVWPKRAHLWIRMSRNLNYLISLPRRKPTSMGSVLALLSVSSFWLMLLHLDTEASWSGLRVCNICLFLGW